MKKLWLFFLTLFLSFSFAHARERCPFVWQIEKAGEPVSYLVGTIHINKKGRELSGCLNNILDKSQLLMTEVFMPVDSIEALNPDSFALFGMLTTGNPNGLRDELGDDLYYKVKNLWQKSPTMQEVLPLYDHLNAWSANMLMTNMTTNPDLSEKNGIDYLLSQRAAAKGIKRTGLESALVGAKIFQELPQDKHIQSLQNAVNHWQEMEKMNVRLIELYNKGELVPFFAYAFNDDEQLKFIPPADREFWKKWIYTTLLDERTASWLPKIQAELPHQSTVIAVGAMHTIGKNGLIELLKNQGYSVEEMSN
ncbi:MAG: TraB/GumN family protein [Neisseriaceae bacterium]|nr:TraB/GumN family protein [Neisseriaceae bacterium]